MLEHYQYIQYENARGLVKKSYVVHRMFLGTYKFYDSFELSRMVIKANYTILQILVMQTCNGLRL